MYASLVMVLSFLLFQSLVAARSVKMKVGWEKKRAA